MSSVMTWGQLVTYLAVFLFLYYGIIVLLFYRRELLLIGKVGNKKSFDRSVSLATSPTASNQQSDDAILYNTVHELMEDCKPVFQAAVNQQLEKAQVIEALQGRIQKYPQLKGTPFQIAVSNHIEQELDHRCGIRLLENDLESLWQG